MLGGNLVSRSSDMVQKSSYRQPHDLEISGVGLDLDQDRVQDLEVSHDLEVGPDFDHI